MQIAARMCNQCLFTQNRIVSEERAASILKQCAREKTHFICHKFSLLHRGSQVMCRGHYEAVERGELPAPELLKCARRLKVLTFVELPPEKAERGPTEEDRDDPGPAR
jgi:hypothetical protein